ncbi:transcription elongation factor GreA [Candidatus Malacoplasma girerdii]|uniref:Transcription elongation factor GreA n=1 Tax=Candidatus Malacoplasma girerdii TaxID=1318617 RepID=A0A097SSM6_9BACT|nr:transcription elongation factor GreA [Candidatus Malacoplasma girerdii]ASJ89041.1 MAG: transcription elongation factor GreA [Candidatus Malacoplasma girerdii]
MQSKPIEQNKILLSRDGLKKVQSELRELIDVKRPAIIKAIQEAREQGDLSENADYDAAKNQQGEIENRIAELKNIINKAEIIEENTSTTGTKVKIGSRVQILDLSDNEYYTYHIVGEVEADPDNNKISNQSPLAKSMLNKSVSSTIEVHGVENPYKIKILKIEN